MATGPYENERKSAYPLTKMNFLVTVDGIPGSAAFSEITGVEATVDVIEFRHKDELEQLERKEDSK